MRRTRGGDEAGKTARESIQGAGRPQGASRLTRPGAARGGALRSPVMAAAMERVEEGRSLRLGGAARCPSGEPRGERRACNGRPGWVDGVRKYRPGADGISNTVHPLRPILTVGLVMCGRDRPRIQLREPHGMHPPRQAQARQLGGAMAGGPRDKSVTRQPEEPDCERVPCRWSSLAAGQAGGSLVVAFVNKNGASRHRSLLHKFRVAPSSSMTPPPLIS